MAELPLSNTDTLRRSTRTHTHSLSREKMAAPPQGPGQCMFGERERGGSGFGRGGGAKFPAAFRAGFKQEHFAGSPSAPRFSGPGPNNQFAPRMRGRMLALAAPCPTPAPLPPALFTPPRRHWTWLIAPVGAERQGDARAGEHPVNAG